MFVNYFWQQCIIDVHDALGHLAGLLCIKFRKDILIINVARPILLEFAELAHSPIYPPSSIHCVKRDPIKGDISDTGPMLQSVTMPSTGLGQCADSGIEFISMEQYKSYTPVIHVHGQLDRMHTHSHTTMHTRVRPTSKWREQVPRPSQIADDRVVFIFHWNIELLDSE
jgi:hypothetical protein